jgi:hypothetical protein
LNWAAGTAASLSASYFLAEAYAVVTAVDPKAAFQAAVAKNVNLPLSDPSLTPVWCPFVPQMASGAPAAVVTASTSVVPKSDPNVKADAGRQSRDSTDNVDKFLRYAQRIVDITKGAGSPALEPAKERRNGGRPADGTARGRESE